MSMGVLWSSDGPRFRLNSLTSTWEFERIQMSVMLREVACKSASLRARASASKGEDTCNWIMDPWLSSEEEGEAKIQLILAVEESDLQAAHVL